MKGVWELVLMVSILLNLVNSLGNLFIIADLITEPNIELLTE